MAVKSKQIFNESPFRISGSNGYFLYDESGSVTLNFGGANVFQIDPTGSVTIAGDLVVDGNLIAPNISITASSAQTASYAFTASYLEGGIESSSYALFSETASYLLGGIESASFAQTSSHLQEQGIAIFSPIDSIPGYISGGIFYSSSGEWYFS